MNRRLSLAVILAVTTSVAVWTPGFASGHESSNTLPNGTPINVSIDDPADGSEFLIAAGDTTRDITISGEASIGQGDPDATLVYVVDVSGSTDEGSGTGCAPILVCEQNFVKELNDAAVANGSVDEVGVVVFASSAAAADMSGDPGDQLLTAPTGTNLDTVVDSMFSVFGGDGGVSQFAPRNVGVETNYAAALQQAQTVVAASSNGTNIVVFVSDGGSNIGTGFNDAVNDLETAGVIVQSIAVGNLDSTGDPITCTSGTAGTLQEMAVNGGECRVVADPGNLPDIIPDLISSSLDSLSLSVNGDAASLIPNDDINPDLPQDGPAMVEYSTDVTLGVGVHTVCVTANGTDVGGSGDSGPACVDVELFMFDAAPDTATNELGIGDQSHTVTAALTGPAGDLEGRLVSFSFLSGPNFDAGTTFTCGVNADCTTDADGNVSMTYAGAQGPAGLGIDQIQAELTLNDPLGETATVVVTKEWVDTTPPMPFCLEGPNPDGEIPGAPGQGGQGQNQDGFYELDAEDAVWPDADIEVFVVDTGSGEVFGPFSVGTVVKYTQTPGGKPKMRPMTGEVDYHIWGNGDMAVYAVDGSGNQSDPVACLVPPPPQ